MKEGRIKVLSFVFFLVAMKLFSDSPYEVNLLNEMEFLGSGMMIYHTKNLKAKDIDLLPGLEIQVTARRLDDINRVDRWAARPYHDRPDRWSDIVQACLMVAPVTFLLDKEMEEIGILGLMYAETIFISSNLARMSKTLVHRNRPYMYFQEGTGWDYRSTAPSNSFFSGHTTTAFTNAAFITSVFSDYYPDSPWRYAVGVGSFGLASTVGLLRITSGNHFISSYDLIITICSLSSFLLLLFLLLRNKITYIKTIHDGIENMAGGQLGSQIPLKGHNELSTLALSINNMAQSLQSKLELEEKHNKKHQNLITNISHDLRTPLTSIIGYLDLLKQNKEGDVEQIRNYSAIAYEKSRRMRKLIDDLFTYSKLINKDYQFSLEKKDLTLFMTQYYSEAADRFQGANLSLVTDFPDFPIYANIDVFQIMRVFDNLTDNIIKYCRSNSTARVSLRAMENRAILEFSNETDVDLNESTDLIFDRLYVVEVDEDKASSGIGLSIVSEIVKTLGGIVSASYKDPDFTLVIELESFKTL